MGRFKNREEYQLFKAHWTAMICASHSKEPHFLIEKGI
jgi:hypothetical protein